MKKIKYKTGYKYRLDEDYTQTIKIYPQTQVNTRYIDLDIYGHLIVKSGYCWDGPSGPTVDTKSSMRGSLVHDALYQLIREDKLPRYVRRDADKLAYRMWLRDGMNKFRAWVWMTCVRTLAGYAIDPRESKEVIEAP